MTKRSASSFSEAHWLALASFLALVAVLNINWRLKAESQVTSAELRRKDASAEVSQQQVKLADLVGRRVEWPAGLVSAADGAGAPLLLSDGYSVIATVDDFACQIPQSSITTMLAQLQRAVPSPERRLTVVVESDDVRSAINYRLVNSFPFAVWLDAGGLFRTANSLPQKNMIVVVDRAGKIVGGYSPDGAAKTDWPASKRSVFNLLVPPAPK